MLGACSSDAPDQSALVVEPSTPTTLVARQAGTPTSSTAPTTTSSTSTLTTPTPTTSSPIGVVHVLGALATLPGDTAGWDDRIAPVTDDLGTITTLGCELDTVGCEPERLTLLGAASVDVISLATDIAEQSGADALELAADALETRAVGVVGFGETIEDAVAPIVLGNGNASIAIHAISLSPEPPVAEATASGAGIAGASALPLMIRSLEASVADGRGVVLLVDWGPDEVRAPAQDRADRAALFAEIGVDAVIGSGSGYLHRLDRINNTTVAFDLGSAVTAETDVTRTDTAVARLEFGTPGVACLLPATADPDGPVLDDVVSC